MLRLFFKKHKLPFAIATIVSFLLLNFSLSSCWVYSFHEKVSTIPDSVKTVRVQPFENRAPYQNPQVAPQITDRLRQKIVGQTKLTSTNSDNAHWDISGRIDDYSIATTGVTSANGQQQSSINRLNVRVHITINKRLENKTEEFDASRSFDFSANKSFEQAQSEFLDEMIRNLTDEIFNHLFSNW